MKVKYLIAFAFNCFIAISHSSVCGPPINPVTDVKWDNMLPIRIGGAVSIGSPTDPAVVDEIQSTVCICDVAGIKKTGISVSFWEPSRLIDTVQDPYCMMSIGNVTGSSVAKLRGDHKNDYKTGSKIFAQMHYYIFPVFAILDMYTDLPCIDFKSEFDVAMMTEVLPTWNIDSYSILINPEAVLVANPAAQLACAADSASAIAGPPIDALWWCAGGWGGTYPISGSATAQNFVEGNALLAARGIFQMGRLGLLKEYSPSGCGIVFTPLWNKSRYRLQQTRPVVSAVASYIGKPGLLWTGGKHPPVNYDNFQWLMFKKINCCVTP